MEYLFIGFYWAFQDFYVDFRGRHFFYKVLLAKNRLCLI